MRKFIKQRVRNTLFHTRRAAGFEKSLVLSGEIRASQISATGILFCLADAEFSVFSQWGEDGIITWLTSFLNIKNQTFVEFGVEDYRESNTRFLLMSRNWSGLVIDGSQENIDAILSDDIAYKFDLQTKCAFITRDNIANLIANARFGSRIGILSVDIDGNDYWILEKTGVEADIIVVEYNALFNQLPVSIPYKEDFSRLTAHPSGMYWGASLPAFRYQLEKRGYIFIGTNRVGTNAFFVHQEHGEKVRGNLRSFVEFECRMREARTADGSLSYQRYADTWQLIGDLAVVHVESGKQIRVKDCVAK